MCCLDACYLGFPVRCESLVCLSSKQLNASLSLLKAPKGSVLSLSSSGTAGADLSSSRKAHAPAKFRAPSAGAEPCTETAFAELWAKRFHGRVTCASFFFPFPSLSHRVSPDPRMGNLLRNRRFTVPPASLPPPSLPVPAGGSCCSAVGTFDMPGPAHMHSLGAPSHWVCKKTHEVGTTSHLPMTMLTGVLRVTVTQRKEARLVPKHCASFPGKLQLITFYMFW